MLPMTMMLAPSPPLVFMGEEWGCRQPFLYFCDFEGGLDVVLLGMGEDGHVASLFPGRRPPAGGWVAWVEDSPKPPPRRITLTREILRTATTTILLATGAAKRTALERVIAGDPGLPAVGLPGLVVVTDQRIGGST